MYVLALRILICTSRKRLRRGWFVRQYSFFLSIFLNMPQIVSLTRTWGGLSVSLTGPHDYTCISLSVRSCALTSLTLSQRPFCIELWVVPRFS